MHTSLAAQLAQLELGHLKVDRILASGPAEPPDPEAVSHTLSAVWSELFALFPETALEDDAEELAYTEPIADSRFHPAGWPGMVPV